MSRNTKGIFEEIGKCKSTDKLRRTRVIMTIFVQRGRERKSKGRSLHGNLEDMTHKTKKTVREGLQLLLNLKIAAYSIFLSVFKFEYYLLLNDHIIKTNTGK